MLKATVRWKLLSILFFLYSFQANSTEYQPWLGNYYEFEFRSSVDYQGSGWLTSGSHLKKYTANNIFLNLSFCNAIPDPSLGIEFEVTEARTRVQHGEIDNLKLTGRYLWQDDVAGDSISLITGLSYTQAFKKSLKDPNSFHHGLHNTEFFISFGKENPDEWLWGSRLWCVCALGIAEQGSPWLRFNVDADKRWCEKHEMSLFVHSLWGFGHKNLYLHDFQGYGPIKHQSIDFGMRYTYVLEYYGCASVEYSYRVYAHNFPAYVHSVIAQILYTFGL